MSGPGFSAAAQEYAAAGIVPLPLGGEDGKRPLVRHPQKFGIKASLEIAPKFPDANLGFWCGQRNKLTIVDIDSPQESELRWALNTFGPSPIIVRTGGKKYHVWYRYSGERRRIRQIKGHAIDLLGEGGLCVAPPSVRPGGGPYEFLEGSLADVARLPAIHREAVSGPISRPTSTTDECPHSKGSVVAGNRNTALFADALTIARNAPAMDALLQRLQQANAETNNPPLPECEVSRIAASAWRYKTKGRLFSKGEQHVVLRASAIDRLGEAGDPDAALLYMRLQKAHWSPGKAFAVSPAAMARDCVLGSWNARRYRNALRQLCDLGLLERLKEGGRGKHDPAMFRFR